MCLMTRFLDISRKLLGIFFPKRTTAIMSVLADVWLLALLKKTNVALLPALCVHSAMLLKPTVSTDRGAI